MYFSNISTLKLHNKMSSVLSFFPFYFRSFRFPFVLSVFLSLFQLTVHTAQPPAESPLLRLACGPAVSRGGPLRRASRSPPALVCRLGRSARPRRAVPSVGRPPRQRPRASSGGRAVGAAAACLRLVLGTLEPVVGRPWRPLSERSFPSATFIRAATQPAKPG